MNHRKGFTRPAGMPGWHLVDHNCHGCKSIGIIAAEPLYHASTIAVAQQINAIEVGHQRQLQVVNHVQQEMDIVFTRSPITGLTFAAAGVAGILKSVRQAVRCGC